jgi:flagellar biosynthesis protein FliQ
LLSVTLVIAGPWMLEELTDFTTLVLNTFPEWIRIGWGVANTGLTQPR